MRIKKKSSWIRVCMLAMLAIVVTASLTDLPLRHAALAAVDTGDVSGAKQEEFSVSVTSKSVPVNQLVPPAIDPTKAQPVMAPVQDYVFGIAKGQGTWQDIQYTLTGNSGEVEFTVQVMDDQGKVVYSAAPTRTSGGNKIRSGYAMLAVGSYRITASIAENDKNAAVGPFELARINVNELITDTVNKIRFPYQTVNTVSTSFTLNGWVGELPDYQLVLYTGEVIGHGKCVSGVNDVTFTLPQDTVGTVVPVRMNITGGASGNREYVHATNAPVTLCVMYIEPNKANVGYADPATVIVANVNDEVVNYPLRFSISNWNEYAPDATATLAYMPDGNTYIPIGETEIHGNGTFTALVSIPVLSGGNAKKVVNIRAKTSNNLYNATAWAPVATLKYTADPTPAYPAYTPPMKPQAEPGSDPATDVTDNGETDSGAKDGGEPNDDSTDSGATEGGEPNDEPSDDSETDDGETDTEVPEPRPETPQQGQPGEPETQQPPVTETETNTLAPVAPVELQYIDPSEMPLSDNSGAENAPVLPQMSSKTERAPVARNASTVNQVGQLLSIDAEDIPLGMVSSFACSAGVTLSEVDRLLSEHRGSYAELFSDAQLEQLIESDSQMVLPLDMSAINWADVGEQGYEIPLIARMRVSEQRDIEQPNDFDVIVGDRIGSAYMRPVMAQGTDGTVSMGYVFEMKPLEGVVAGQVGTVQIVRVPDELDMSTAQHVDRITYDGHTNFKLNEFIPQETLSGKVVLYLSIPCMYEPGVTQAWERPEQGEDNGASLSALALNTRLWQIMLGNEAFMANE